jgi:response regulator NasT
MTIQAPTQTHDAVPQRQIPARPSRILVADDEYLVAAELTTWLVDGGYTTVGPVGTGAEAVRLAQVAKPDLALLDIRMPNGDGLSAAKAIMRDLFIPVIILTAYCDKEYLQVAEEAGVFAYLIKPAEPEQLAATIEIAWGRFRRFAEECDERQRLARRLEERKVVEQAKWMLVQRAKMDEPTALRALQQRARRNREPLLAVAQRVLAGAEDLSDR